MKKLLCCTLLVIFAAALLTTGALAFDMLDPPRPDAADGWFETQSVLFLHNPMSGSWEEQSRRDTSYEYNADNLPVKSTEVSANYDSTDVSERIFEYDSQGRLTSEARSDGNHEMKYTYRDDGSFLETYTWWYDDDPENIRTSDYTYDPQVDWFWWGVWNFEMDSNGSIARRWSDTLEYVYTTEYDSAGRRSSVRVECTKDHTVNTLSYTYAPDGGYTMRDSTKTGYEEFVYNAKGLLTKYINGYSDKPYEWNYIYDDNGNCIEAASDTRRYTYAYENPRMKEQRYFEDVTDPNAFYFAPVYWAVEKGITTGATPTTFSPEKACTRAQVVTFLWRAAGSPAAEGTANPFTDVAPGAYYYDAVLWAVKNGITTGTSATAFSPDSTCTRGQVVTFLWRAAGKPEPAANANPFADVTGNDYFCKAVLWALEKNITRGTTESTFSPQSQCQRAHVVTFLYRSMEGIG